MGRFHEVMLAVLFLNVTALCGCQNLVPHDTSSLFVPTESRII